MAAHVFRSRVRETSNTTGSGPLTLAGAVAGYQAFSAVYSIGDTVWYAAVHSATSWETGVGTYSSANTLTRTTILESSNSGSAIIFGAGAKDVFIGSSPIRESDLFDSTGHANHVRWDAAQSLTPGQKTQAKSNIGFTDGTTGGFSAGDVKLTYKTIADQSWVMMNDGTFGSSASGASYANDNAANAYAVIWAIGSAAAIPILTSAGVSSTYGANATADFAANKRLTLPKTLGRALAGAGSGATLTVRLPGQTAGAESVTLDTTQIPAHSHTATVTDPGHSHTLSGMNGGGDPAQLTINRSQIPTTSATNSATTGITVANSNTGGDGAHNNMQPTAFLNVMLKL